MLITRIDPFSKRKLTLNINITKKELKDWLNGMYIQEAMPSLSADEREFIMTGITSESWNESINRNCEETQTHVRNILNNKEDT
jgi:hypothetical protein